MSRVALGRVVIWASRIDWSSSKSRVSSPNQERKILFEAGHREQARRKRAVVAMWLVEEGLWSFFPSKCDILYLRQSLVPGWRVQGETGGPFSPPEHLSSAPWPISRGISRLAPVAYNCPPLVGTELTRQDDARCTDVVSNNGDISLGAKSHDT